MEAVAEKIDITGINAMRILDTDVFLHNLGINQGKIIISNSWGKNYSYYWGAMGGTIEEFIKSISSDYLANKLLGATSMWALDCAGTFKNIRKYIREEIGLKWFMHTEFQKEMRYHLKKYQDDCEENHSEVYFNYSFLVDFVYKLDFDLIEDKYDRKEIEKQFKVMSSEPWLLIIQKESEDYKWIVKFHKELKAALIK